MPPRDWRTWVDSGALRLALTIVAAAGIAAGALWWASGVSYGVAATRARAGIVATGEATLRGEQAAWQETLRVVRSATERSSILGALSPGHALVGPGLSATLGNMLQTDPLRTVQLYDGTRLLGRAGPPWSPSSLAVPTAPTFGPVVMAGPEPVREVRVPVVVGGRAVGLLVVTVDIPGLIAESSFGRTGVELLVTRTGRIVGGPQAYIGQVLRTPANRAIAAAGHPVTASVYSRLFHRWAVESYLPVVGQPLGVITSQARSEAMAGATALADDAGNAALLLLAGGLACAWLIGAVVRTRWQRRQAHEAELEEVETRMGVAWSTSPLGMAIVSTEGTWMGVNPAACRMFGLREDELVGRPVSEMALPDEGDGARPMSLGIDDDPSEAAALERQFRRSDGSTWLAAVTYAPVPGPDGSVSYIISQYEDVTDRKDAEAALRRSQERYRRTLESLGAGVVLFDATGVCLVPVMANEVAVDILGDDPVAAGTVEHLRLSTSDGSTMTLGERTAAPVAGTGESQRFEQVRLGRPDGTHRWLNVVTTALLDEDGSVASVISSFMDVTAAHEAGAALDAVRARADALIENGSDLVTVADRDGLLTYASPACTRLLGWPRDDLIGKPVLLLVHPDDAARVAEIHRDLLERPGETIRYQCRMRHRDGSWRHVEVVRTNHLDDPAIAGVVANKRDVTERVEAAQLIAHRATHDDLTGLPNRALLLDRLAAALARASRTRERCALMFIDLDRFKTINDSLGHAAGDDLLCAVAERLRSAMRPADTVARLGGDEFVVLAEQVPSIAAATEIAERIRSAVNHPVTTAGATVEVSCSVGISLSSTNGPETMLQEADTALYRAKERGRNRHELFDQAMRTIARRRLEAERDLRLALKAGGVVVHYQPIVELAGARTVGAEALVRLKGADGHLIPPGEFIDVAEESGIVVPLGAEVLRQACGAAARWHAEHPAVPPTGISVNLSARQLARPSLVAEVAETLAGAGLAAEHLCLELTENTLIDAGSAMRQAVEDLVGLGVRIAIDDFGTGWSSLSYLRRFPITVLKIDRSFVNAMATSSEDLEIVKAVLGLGASLGLQVVAEGVETEAQAALLVDLGCRYAQGWLFGRPGEPATIGARIGVTVGAVGA